MCNIQFDFYVFITLLNSNVYKQRNYRLGVEVDLDEI